jgi:Xaa-Pro aminopeptidase
MANQQNDPYFIDFPGRIKAIQEEMKKENIGLYLGSRLRTMSWTTDAFFPWRSFIIIPAEGLPYPITFLIDMSRAADDSWLPVENFVPYPTLEVNNQLEVLVGLIGKFLPNGGRVGIESGMSNYLPEGFLTHYEYVMLDEMLPNCELVNAYDIIERLALIKDEGTQNRFREASRIVDVGQLEMRKQLQNGGWKGLTETEIAGMAALAMRKEGSLWEWSFTGGNEIASGYRTAYPWGACTPPTTRKVQLGEPLMVDIHALFKLACGDYCHNYIIGEPTAVQKKHMKNFISAMEVCRDNYKAGATPAGILAKVFEVSEKGGFTQNLSPGVEHGIGMLGDEWRVGRSTDAGNPFWTDKNHVYQEDEVVIWAAQYFCTEDGIGFRYENPTIIHKDGCEPTGKLPLEVTVIE